MHAYLSPDAEKIKAQTLQGKEACTEAKTIKDPVGSRTRQELRHAPPEARTGPWKIGKMKLDHTGQEDIKQDQDQNASSPHEKLLAINFGNGFLDPRMCKRHKQRTPSRQQRDRAQPNFAPLLGGFSLHGGGFYHPMAGSQELIFP